MELCSSFIINKSKRLPSYSSYYISHADQLELREKYRLVPDPYKYY